MRVLIIIPAYNEAENIQRVVDDLRLNYPQYDYVVINDCSVDQTPSILSSIKANHINLPVNLGIGGSVQTGYRYALEHDYEIAVQVDGDGQHDPKYIKDLIEPIEGGQADVVIGSRFIEKEGFQATLSRHIGINLLRAMVKGLCGIHVLDITSGMRAVNKRMIAKYAENYAQDYPEPEAVLAAAIMRAKILEVPVKMRKRQSGTSSINALRAIYYMIKVSVALVVTRMTLR